MTTTLSEFARLGSATVYEAIGQRGLVDGDWIRVIPGSAIAGPARTVQCGQGDNLMVHELLADVRPGDVLVLTMPQPAPFALVGDLMVTQAKVQGAAGVIVDAAVRDIDALREIGLPVWARWISMRGTTKHTVGAIDVPVVVGNQVIAMGDIVIADADGVAVVPADEVSASLELARDREAKENAARDELLGGAFTRDVFGFELPAGGGS